MVVINNKEENEFLKQQIETNINETEYWIGLIENDSKNSYNWVDGSDFAFGNSWNTDPWKNNEPNNV